MTLFWQGFEKALFSSFHPHHDKYRIKMLRALMVVCVFLLPFEAAALFYLGKTILAYSEIPMIVCCIIFFRKMWRNVHLFGNLFTIWFFLLWCIACALYISNISLWIFSTAFPVLFIFFLGRKKGVFVSAAYCGPMILSCIYHWNIYQVMPVSLESLIVYAITLTYTFALTISFELTYDYLLKDLHQRAEYDELTNLYSRRMFFDLFKHDLVQAERRSFPISILLLDIDNFKMINDAHGHPAGDEVLKVVAHTCHNTLRKNDVLGRVGGEEFACLLPNTNQREAALVAEKIRKAIAGLSFDFLPCCTISIGVAEFVAGDSSSSMYKRADQALYLAKEQGRNRVCVDLPSESALF